MMGRADSGATLNLRFVTILSNDSSHSRLQKEEKMSNHFTGLSLGPPLGDQRLDLCDLYAFQSPADPSRTVVILNANPNADALHPDAIYRLNIDNDGDLLTDVALSYVFSKPQNGKQTFNVFLAKGAQSRSVEAVGNKIVADAEVSFDRKPNLVKAGDYTFFAGSRSDAFFFDFDGIKNLFDIRAYRSQRLLDGGRTADERTSPEARNTHLGTMQRAAGQQAGPRRSRGPSECQQFFQHRRHEVGIQRQRAGERSQALARSVRASDGPHRKLLARRSDCRDRQGGYTARRAEFRSVETCAVPQRPRLH